MDAHQTDANLACLEDFDRAARLYSPPTSLGDSLQQVIDMYLLCIHHAGALSILLNYVRGEKYILLCQ